MTSTITDDYLPSFSGEPTFEMLPVSVLEVDPSYQRDQDAAFDRWVKHTLKNFNRHMLGALMVAKVGDRYFVWDGQGRLALVKLVGDEMVMCQISEVDQSQQAHLFTQQANRRTIRWYDLHKANLATGNLAAIEINAAVGSIGRHLSSGGSTSDGVTCVKTLYDLHHRGGAELVNDVLAIANGAWWNAEAGFSDRVIKGLGLFRWAFPEIGNTELVMCFKDISPRQMISEAGVTKNTADKKTTDKNATAVAKYLLRAFNRTTNRKLRLDERIKARRKAERAQ